MEGRVKLIQTGRGISMLTFYTSKLENLEKIDSFQRMKASGKGEVGGVGVPTST